MTKKRLEYIDMVKGLGILGIAAMHSTLLSQQASVWLSSFVTPLFFLASGMLTGCTEEQVRGGKEILRRKGRSLLLPFLCFSLFCLMRDWLRVLCGTLDMEEVRSAGISFVTLWGGSVLWFLPALFLSEVLFLFLCKKFNRAGTCVAVILLAVVSFFSHKAIRVQEAFFLTDSLLYALGCLAKTLLRAACALPFINIGYLLFRIGEDFWRKDEERSAGQLFGGFLLFAAGISLCAVNGYFDFRVLDLGNWPVLAYFSAALSFAGALLVCKNLKPVKPLAYFGRNSLIVMATHVDFYFLYFALFLGKHIMPESGSVISFLFVMTVVFALEIPCIEVVTRFLPFLAGRKRF